MYIKRAIEDAVLQTARTFPALMLTGPRQSGKTTAEPEKFEALEQYTLEIGCGAVICMANDLLPLDRKNWSVPAWLI
jgi:predicted AAA+ superfamily ATPase